MEMPGRRGFACIAAWLAVVLLAGCSARPEQAILNQFFAASRLGDDTSLRTVSTVSFDPRTHGTVTAFDVAIVTPRPRTGTGEGGPTTEDVTVTATVRLPGGQIARETFVVTMQRALLKDSGEATGRWMITAITKG
jgi:hypothetical protein